MGATARSEPLTFERFGPEHGLPHNTVNDILQDRVGFLWIGTDGGLARFDGYGFESHRRLGSGNVVLGLLEDSRGRFWVGTESGLWFFDRSEGTFSDAPLEEASTGYCEAILEDGDGRIWAGIGPAIFRLDPGASSFRRVQPEGPDFERVWSLAEAPDGLWAIVGDAEGLEPELRRVGSADLRARVTRRFHLHLSVDSRGVFWVGPLDRDPGLLGIRTRNLDLGSAPTDVVELEDGVFWIATGRELRRFDPADGSLGSHPVRPDSSSWQSGFVQSVFADRSGGIWAGTLGGLYHHDPRADRFRHWRHDPRDPDSLADDAVSEIVSAPDGGLFVATYGGGLGRFDPATGITERLFPLVPDRLLWSLAWDETEELLWIGTGLTKVFDPGTRRVTSRPLPLQDAAGDPPITAHALLVEAGGPTWVLTYRRGLFAHGTDGSWSHWPDVSGNQLVVGGNGALWVGQVGAVSRLDPSDGSVTRIPLRGPGGESLEDVEVFDLAEARDRLWLATSAGLGSHLPGEATAEVPIAAVELPGSVVFSVAPDDAGRLWLGTNQGLVRFDPRGRPSGRTRVYGPLDGTGNVEFNRSARYRSPDGTLYLGGMSGLTAFRPEEIRDDPLVPPVVLTGIHVLGTRGETRFDPASLDELRLGPEVVAVTFSFTALDFTRAEANRYAFRLDGLDPDWVDAGGERSARYTALPPGRYVFRVRAANDDGVWNLEGASLPVLVLPPFRSTWWFRLLVLAGVLGLLFLAHRLRVRRLLELERIRLRIAGDLHDELGSELAGMALASARLAGRDRLEEGDRRRLEELGSSAIRVLHGLRDVVWSISPDHDTLRSLEDRMRSSARSLLEGVETRFEIELPEGEKPLDMGIRRGLYLIYRELLTNVSRHAGASCVHVALSLRAGRLALEVADDGRGFDPDAASDGSGLASIRRRCRALGAALDVRSTPGSGTRVRIERDISSGR